MPRLPDWRRGGASQELDATPIRTVIVLLLKADLMPCVGQLRQLDLVPGSAQRSAALQACVRHGGFLACAVDTPNAKVLPRGAVGAEICTFEPRDEGRICVTLRGVASLRIIDRTRWTGCGSAETLAQEVAEWTAYEEASGGASRVLEEMRELQDRFRVCGQLQVRADLWAAGDLASRSLDERTSAALAVVEGVSFCGLGGDAAGDSIKAGTQRRAVLAAHAAVSALKGAKLASFLCDPCSTLKRLLALNKFFRVMEAVLRDRG